MRNHTDRPGYTTTDAMIVQRIATLVGGRAHPPGRKRWSMILRADPCSYCGGASGTVDHIDVSGPDNASNMTSACHRCNSSKMRRSLLGHLGRIGTPKLVSVLEMVEVIGLEELSRVYRAAIGRRWL